jgi:nitrogen fixation-related uncharacterized protein
MDDDYTPSVRILFDDIKPPNKPNDKDIPVSEE